MPTRLAAVNRRRAWLTAYLVVLVLSCAWTALGGPLSLLLVFVLAPVFVAVRARVSVGVSLALLLTASCWATLLVFLVSRYLPVPPLVLVLAAALAVGAGSALHLYRVGSTLTKADFADLAFAGTGGILWCAVLAVAWILPGASPVSWAMSGDAANNILFARRVLEDNGIAVGAGQNPVPLTSSLIALFMLPGHSFVAPSVESDILALAQMWSVGIVAASFVSGALVLSLVRRRGPLTYLGVAIGSVLPLSWLALAGSLALGFVNFQLTIALLIGCLLALSRSREGLLTSLVMVAMSLTLVLAVWAPLAGIPGLALVLFLFLHRREVLALRGWRAGVAIAAILQTVAFFVALSLPSFLTQGGALSDAQGAVMSFSRWLLLISAAMAITLGLLYSKVAGGAGGIRILIATLGGGGAGLLLLLWMRRNEADLWGYYQMKFLWLFLVILLIVAVAFGMALASWLEPRGFRSAVLFVAVLVAAAGVGGVAQVTVPSYNQNPQVMRDPLARIVTGDFFSASGDHVFDRVVAMADAESPSVLWRSGDPDEGGIMFWVLQMAATDVDDLPIRTLAYYRDSTTVDDLCELGRLMGPGLEVITADPGLADQAAECKGLGKIVLQ
ncbi:hypothetical protein AAIB33_01855 [Microbacterium sp. AZCO]|uniref:hypothetical protein n=1 Tax=Microbacterium sp. AZCO TaxID=3142976 RepID=UPI0031F46929